MFFHASTFVGTRGSCFNTSLQGRVFKHLPRDLANVNAMKQTCDCYSCILPDSVLKSHPKCRNNIIINVFHSLDLLVQNGISLQNRMSSANNVDINKNIDKMLILGLNVFSA